MSSISAISAVSTPAVVVAPKTGTGPKAAATPASSTISAATLELSQQAKALAQGDKDWKPGQRVDWS